MPSHGEAALIEQQVELTRLALACLRKILSLPLPRDDDFSAAAQMDRETHIKAAQSCIANARRAKEQLARTGEMTELSGVLREIAAFGTVH
jgi:hypothetical protein